MLEKKGKMKVIAFVVIIVACLAAAGFLFFNDSPAENVMLDSSLNDLNLNESSPEKTSTLAEGANEFAFDLYSQLADEENNSLISPYSLYSVLGMIYEGARGKTATEMENALNLPVEDHIRRPAFADLHEKLNSDRTVELETANALWPQENYPFYENYLETIRKYYLARIESVNYASDNHAALKRINEWASERTEGKIKRLLQNLSTDIRLVLTNAVYFKGTWLRTFDEARTEEESFHLPGGSSLQVPMMQFSQDLLEEKSFYYADMPEMKVLKLFYTGKEMSMIFLLPKDESKGVSWLKEHVNGEKLKSIQENLEKKIMNKIKIPKFEYKARY